MTEDDVKERAQACASELGVHGMHPPIIERHLRAYGEKLERERDEARAILRDIIHSHTTITDGLMIRVVVDATVMDRAIRALEERPAGNDDGPL